MKFQVSIIMLLSAACGSVTIDPSLIQAVHATRVNPEMCGAWSRRPLVAREWNQQVTTIMIRRDPLAPQFEALIGMPQGSSRDWDLAPLFTGRLFAFFRDLLKACSQGNRGLVPRRLPPTDLTLDLWRVFLFRLFRPFEPELDSSETRAACLRIENQHARLQGAISSLAELFFEIKDHDEKLYLRGQSLGQLSALANQVAVYCRNNLLKR